MNYYPVMLSLKNKNVLIIGAGNIAHRKLKGLIEHECHITVISKEIDTRILDLKETLAEDQDLIQVLSLELIQLDANIKNIQEHIINTDLLFICTDESALNEKIELQAKKNKVWFLRCDDAGNSDFINPLVVSKGDVKVAVSTSGKSPAYSKHLKQKIMEITDDIDSEHIILLGEARQAVKMSNKESAQIKELLSKLHMMEKKELIEIIEKEKS